MALAGVETGALASYSEEYAADPRLAALRQRTEFDFQSGWPHPRAEIDLHLTDGSCLNAKHDAGVPAANLAEQGSRLEAKFMALAAPLLGETRAADVCALVARFETLAEIDTLMSCCAAG
jgi:hypothetical protein